MSSGRGDDTALPLLDDEAIDDGTTTGQQQQQQQRRQQKRRRLLVLLFALSLASLTLLGPLVAVFLGEIHRRENLEVPCPRKGGVALVFGGGGRGGNGRGGDGENGENKNSPSRGFCTPRLVVWSGKKRGRLSGDADGELQGAVHVLDLDLEGKEKGRKGKWKVVQASSTSASLLSPSSSPPPLPRWKPVAAPLSSSTGALFGGDAQTVEEEEGEARSGDKEVRDAYLGDLWNLELEEATAEPCEGEAPLSVRWTRVSDEPSPSSAAVPQARRAALGVSLLPFAAADDGGDEEEGQLHTKRPRRHRKGPTLLVHGGRGRHKSEGLLSDLWAATQTGGGGGGEGEEAGVEWERLWPPSPLQPPSPSPSSSSSSFSSSPDEGAPPLPRKGHSGVALPPGASLPLFPGPALFLTGGRNDSDAECYHDDTFLFDVEGERKWHGVPFVASPSSSSSSSSSSSFSSSLLRRDHAGAWLCEKEGTVFVFGGRGGSSHEDSRPLGDLLTFDLRSRRWSSSSSPSPSPAPRFLFGVGSYRSADGDTRAVVFGGEGEGGEYYNDAWEFSCGEKEWRSLTRRAAAAG